jgi:flavin-dependent dehydrogenase
VARFDAVIVGASYAGLACAAQMPGRRLLVLERHDSVVSKQRGGLGLLLPVGEKVEIRGGDLFLNGPNLLVEGGVRGRLSRLEIRGHLERIDLTLSRSLIQIDEGRIKGALLRRIRENRVEVRVGVAVREVDTDGRSARVRADEDHQTRLLVGADGAHSVVVRSLGLRRERSAMLFQRELEVDRLDIPPETLVVQIDDAKNYFVAQPLGDRYLACLFQWVAPRGVPADLEAVLQDKVERLGAGRTLAARGAVVRLQRPLAISFRDNVLLTGDAAAVWGLATIGGALTMGSLAGQAANRFLAGSSYALPGYDEAWRKGTQQGLLQRLSWLSPVFSRLSGNRIDDLLRAIRGPTQRRLAPGSVLWRMPNILWRLLA